MAIFDKSDNENSHYEVECGLRQKGANLLAGRAHVYHMYPLTIQEMGDQFNLKHALQFGLLPTAALQVDPHIYLTSYAKTYMREEIMQEGLTRIYPFTQRAKRKVIAHQKFYFFDTGIYKQLRPTSLIDTVAEVDGAGLETLFLQSLQAVNAYHQLQYNIHFWHTVNGDEVDFVVYGPKGFHAFEIKRSSQITSKSLKGLRAFAEEYPEARLHLLFLGKQREYHGAITATPFEQALRELPQLLID